MISTKREKLGEGYRETKRYRDREGKHLEMVLKDASSYKVLDKVGFIYEHKASHAKQMASAETSKECRHRIQPREKVGLTIKGQRRWTESDMTKNDV